MEVCYLAPCWCCESRIRGNPRWNTVPRCACTLRHNRLAHPVRRERAEVAWPGPYRSVVLAPRYTFSSREGNQWPCEDIRSLARWLEPSEELRQALSRARKVLPEEYLGLHLRQIKGVC